MNLGSIAANLRVLREHARGRRTLTVAGVATLGVLCMAPVWWLDDDGIYTGNCHPIEVLDLGNRVHVLCNESFPGLSGNTIRYFAVPTFDALGASYNVAQDAGRAQQAQFRAQRFMSAASMALTSGKVLRVHYSKHNSIGAAYGCVQSNCMDLMYSDSHYGVVPY